MPISLVNLWRELTEEGEENIENYFNADNSAEDDGGKEYTFGADHEPITSDQSDFGDDNA